MNYDLVISGGGMKFYYLLGVKKALEEKKINIKRYSGTSSGSIFIVLIACGIDNDILIKTYQELFKKSNYKMNIINDFLNIVLPENCHLICSDKVFISISKVSLPFENRIISKFESKKHLIEVVKTSSSFPIFVNSNIFYEYENSKHIDGFFTNNTPFFKDTLRNQIIVRPFIVKYENLQIFDMEPNKNIKYIKLGYQDLNNFFNGNHVFAIEWYNPNRVKINNVLIKYVKYLLKFKIIRCLILIIFVLIIFEKKK